MHSSRMRTTHSSSYLSACCDTPRCGPGDPSGCGPGDPPGVGLETPLGAGLETPRPDPSTSPLGVGLETHHPGQTPQLPPWVWAWRPTKHAGIPPFPRDLQGMLGYHLQCKLGYHTTPLCTEFLTHTTENIILPQTSFAGGKYNKR